MVSDYYYYDDYSGSKLLFKLQLIVYSFIYFLLLSWNQEKNGGGGGRGRKSLKSCYMFVCNSKKKIIQIWMDDRTKEEEIYNNKMFWFNFIAKLVNQSALVCVCVDRDDTNECARARFFQDDDDDDDEKVDNYSIYPHDEDWIFFSFSLWSTHKA